MFQKIPHNRTADAVVRQIEALILDGVLRPGDRLPAERELARQVDVSRPILREALKRLEEKGLLATRHGEGTFVADVIGPLFAPAMAALFRDHPKATADYLEFRREVEAIAAAHAAERATEADRIILTRVFEAMAAAHESEDFEAEVALDVEFHETIGECAHNIVLMHMLRACYRLLADGVFYNRARLYAHPGARGALIGQHRAMYRAIMDGDPAAARAATETHIRFVENATREVERLGAWQEVAAMRLAKLDRAGRPGARIPAAPASAAGVALLTRPEGK